LRQAIHYQEALGISKGTLKRALDPLTHKVNTATISEQLLYVSSRIAVQKPQTVADKKRTNNQQTLNLPKNKMANSRSLCAVPTRPADKS
jgi:hypothetical protein